MTKNTTTSIASKTQMIIKGLCMNNTKFHSFQKKRQGKSFDCFISYNKKLDARIYAKDHPT